MKIRDKIISASATLFLQHGLRSVTMDDVASSIGISKRTIYETFKDKRELIGATVEFFINSQQCDRQQIEQRSENLVEELFSVFDIMDEGFSRRGRVSLEVRKYYPDIFEKHYLKHYDQASQSLILQLKRGMAQGIILPDTNVKFAAYVIMETINNLMVNPDKTFTSTKVSPQESFKYVIIYFFRGISTQMGIDLIDRKIAEKNKRDE